MMVDRPIDNFTERHTWRIQLEFGVAYGTKREQMVGIKSDVLQYLHDHPQTTLENYVYFSELGPSSL